MTPETVRRGVEAKIRELGQQVRVPGFRPGKAPRRVIENRLGGHLDIEANLVVLELRYVSRHTLLVLSPPARDRHNKRGARGGI
ncbi:MAG: trigger factor family protein [Rubrobacteraceae bacterium]